MDTADNQPQEIDVDQIIQEANEPTPPRADSSPEPEPAPEPVAPAWDAKQYEFDWNGKKVAPDSREKLMTWASQGYNYSQRMAEFNKRQADLAAREKSLETYKRYEVVDQYAKDNPEWWDHVTGSYEKRSQYGVPQELAPVLNPLTEKIGQIEQFMTEYQQRAAQEDQAKLDNQLNDEIESIRKSHPNIDLASTDASGEPLELRILKHAQQIGTNSFKAAFRDYLHDQLIELAKTDGRQAIAKGQQEAAKKGLLGTTQAPVKGLKPAQNLRQKSYGDLAREALEEFGLSN
jgi:hypothetical protein